MESYKVNCESGANIWSDILRPKVKSKTELTYPRREESTEKQI